MQILDQAFEAALTFKPMSKTEVAALLSRTSKFGHLQANLNYSKPVIVLTALSRIRSG